MTKRKLSPVKDSAKYKQTDIALYFKVRHKLTMNTQFSLAEKENDSQEVIVRKRPPPKTLSSDEETDLATQSVKSDSEVVVTRRCKPVQPLPSDNESEEEVRVEVSKSVLEEWQLPYVLPHYTDSEDSDVTYCSSKSTPSMSVLQSVNAVSAVRGSPMKSNSKYSTQSSDDDDFELPPRKIPKQMPCKTSPAKNGKCAGTSSSPGNSGRNVKKKLINPANKSMSIQRQHENTDNILNTSQTTNSTLTRKQDEQLGSSVSHVNMPSTSKGVYSSGTVSRFALGANSSTVTTTPKDKLVAQAVKRATNQEFISTNLLSDSIIQALTPNKSNSALTMVAETNKNSGSMSTPDKVTIVADIRLSVNKTQASVGKSGLNTSKASTTPAQNSNSTKKVRKVYKRNSSAVCNIEGEEWCPYILKIVKRIVQFICSHNYLQTMLTKQETDMLNLFFQMPDEKYISLCIKLFIKVQGWSNIFQLIDTFNMKMSGPEVKAMYMYLSEKGFIDTDFSSEPLESILNCLPHKDMKSICQNFKIELTSFKMPNMIAQLLMFCNVTSRQIAGSNQKMLRDAIQEKIGLCIRLNSMFCSILQKVHVLYSFVNELQSTEALYSFMARIENKEEFLPKVPVDVNSQLFSSITEFSNFLDAYECKRAVQEAYNNKESQQIFQLCAIARAKLDSILESVVEEKPAYLRLSTTGNKYTEALSLGVKYLVEHSKSATNYTNQVQEWLIFLLAQKHYCQQLRGSWYDSLFVIQYYRLHKHNDAIATLIKAFESGNLLDVDVYQLRIRAEAIKESKAHKITQFQRDSISCVEPKAIDEFRTVEISRQIKCTNKKKRKKISEESEDEETAVSIHDEALAHYKKYFPNLLHCESNLLVTIFYVLFWDIIYHRSVPAAFVNEIQYIPLDLLTKDFYTNREAMINQRLDDVRCSWPSGQLECFVCDVWENHAHEKSFISDEIIDEAKQLYDIILCIGRVKLARILKRIAVNFNAYRLGIPDLFLWSVSQKKCRFVQVKEEKGTIPPKNALWMDFLRSVGADVEVCIIKNVAADVAPNRTVMLEKIKIRKKEEKKCLNKSNLAKSFIL